MFRTAQRRLRIVILVALSLLFSQLALANYVCPTAAAPDQAVMVMEMAPGEPCQGMGAEPPQTALCHQHCANAPQFADAVKLPALSLPAIVQVVLLPLSLDPAAQQADAFADAGQAHPPPEPVFLATLRLRV